MVRERGGGCNVYFTCMDVTHACAFSRDTSSVKLSISSLREGERGRGRGRGSVSNSATASRGSFGAQVARLHCFLDAEHASVALHLHLRSRYKGE